MLIMKKLDALKTATKSLRIPKVAKTPRIPKIVKPKTTPKISLLDNIITYFNYISIWLSTFRLIQYFKLILPRISNFFVLSFIPFILTFIFHGKKYIKWLWLFYTIVGSIFFATWWLDIPLTPEVILYLIYSAYLSIVVKITCCIDNVLQFCANIINKIRNIFIPNLDDPNFKQFKNQFDEVKVRLGIKKDEFTDDYPSKQEDLFEDTFDGIPLSTDNKLAAEYTDTYNKVKDNPTVKAATPDYNDNSFFERNKTAISLLCACALIFGISYYMDPEGTKEFFKTSYDFYKDIFNSAKNWISSFFTSDSNPKPDGSSSGSVSKGKHVTFEKPGPEKSFASTSATTLDDSTSSAGSDEDTVNDRRIKKVTGFMVNNIIENFVNNLMDGIKGRKPSDGSYVNHLDRLKDNPLVQSVHTSEPGTPIEISKTTASSLQQADSTSSNTSTRGYQRRFERAMNDKTFTPNSQAESKAFQDYLEAQAKLLDNMDQTPQGRANREHWAQMDAQAQAKLHGSAGTDQSPGAGPSTNPVVNTTPSIITHNLDTPPHSPTESVKEIGAPPVSPASEQGVGEDIHGIRQHKNSFSELATHSDNNDYDSDRTPTQSTILEKPKDT